MNVAITSTSKRPGTGGYWIGGGMILLGIGTFIASFVVVLGVGLLGVIAQLADVEPIEPQGSRVMVLQPGGYVVFTESGLGRATIEGPDGRVELTPPRMSQTIEIGEFSGTGFGQFEVDHAGPFTVTNDGEARIAVTTAPFGRSFTIALISLFVGVALVIIGIILLIVTGIRRGKSKGLPIPAGVPGQYPAWNPGQQYRYPPVPYQQLPHQPPHQPPYHPQYQPGQRYPNR